MLFKKELTSEAHATGLALELLLLESGREIANDQRALIGIHLYNSHWYGKCLHKRYEQIQTEWQLR